MTSSDFSYSIPPDFTFRRLYQRLRRLWNLRPYETSLVPPPTIPTFRSPYAGGVLRGCFSRVFTSSMAFACTPRLGSPWFPLSGLTYRRCRIPFMVRTVELHLLLRGYSASAQPVTRMHWELATRLSGDYRGRTFTGKLMVTSSCDGFRKAHGVPC